MRVAGPGRLRIDLRRRHARVQGGAHIAEVGGQKQVGMQWLQIAPGRRAPVEGAALDVQAVMLGRAEHAHARHRVVARQDDHFHALAGCGRVEGFFPAFGRVVESQQLFDQRKRHARLGRHIEPLQLQLHVGRVFLHARRCLGPGVLREAGFKHLVFFLKIKQGARGNRHHELTLKTCQHGLPLLVLFFLSVGCSAVTDRRAG